MSTALKTEEGSVEIKPDEHGLTIGLALSGGGFRATLFHLGVLKCLADANLLCRVTHVTSVSGGSILAAHLFENWNTYLTDFSHAAEPLLSFIQYDIRGRILRRLPYSLVYPRWRRTRLLQNYYHRLFLPKLSEAAGADVVAADLPPRPRLAILATNLNTGSMYAFSEQYVYVASRTGMQALRTDLPLTSLKVAISSAFPGFFPPITLSHRDVALSRAEFQESQCFTDGGIFDNLGIRFFQRAFELHAKGQTLPSAMRPGDYFWNEVPQIVLASNASSAFDVRHGTNSLFRTALRAVDILMNRIGVMDVESIIDNNGSSSQPFHYLGLDSLIETDQGERCLNIGLQKAIRFMRTDLDAFTRFECACLIHQGYCVAREQLRRLELSQHDLGDTAANVLADSLVAVDKHESWKPFGDKLSVAETPMCGDAPTESSTAIVERQCGALHRGSKTRLRFFSFTDPIPSLMNAAVLIALLAGVVSLFGVGRETDWRSDAVVARIMQDKQLRIGLLNPDTIGEDQLGFILYPTERGGRGGLDVLLMEHINRELPSWFGFGPDDEFKRPRYEPVAMEHVQRLLNMPKNGEVDFIISSISFKVDRESEYDLRFSVPYYFSSLSLVGQQTDLDRFTEHKSGTPPYEGRKVLVWNSTTAASVAQSMKEALGWDVEPCESPEVMRESLKQDADKMVLIDTPMANSWVNDSLESDVVVLNPSDFPDSVKPEQRRECYAIAVSKKSPRLLWAINGILMELALKREEQGENLRTLIERAKTERDAYQSKLLQHSSD